VTDAQARLQPAANAWSLRQILAHLDACSRVWQPSISAMLDEDIPELTCPHPRAIQFSPEIYKPAFGEAVERFARNRRSFLDRLAGVDATAFDRGGIVNARRTTALAQLQRLARHEERHEPEISALLAFMNVVK
jgi:hypothetical protein